MTAKRKILCIEDDRETAALIAEESTERGFDVVIAHDGSEGLAAIFKTMPDLILCDISMGVMSGFEVLELLTRIAPHFGNMQFVFLTALTDRNSELKGRQLGADDYVTKPIDFDKRAEDIRLPHRQLKHFEVGIADGRSQLPVCTENPIGLMT
jgi:DNA-binding response OmpR family regulator